MNRLASKVVLMAKLTSFIISIIVASMVVCITSFAYECIEIRLPPTPAHLMELLAISAKSAFPIFIGLLFVCYFASSLVSRYLLPERCRFCFLASLLFLTFIAGFLAEFLSRRHTDGMELAAKAGIRSAVAFVLIILPAALLLNYFQRRIWASGARE